MFRWQNRNMLATQFINDELMDPTQPFDGYSHFSCRDMVHRLDLLDI